MMNLGVGWINATFNGLNFDRFLPPIFLNCQGNQCGNSSPSSSTAVKINGWSI